MSSESVLRVLNEGGSVLVAIIVASVLAWALLFAKWVSLHAERLYGPEDDGGMRFEAGESGRAKMELWIDGEWTRLYCGLGPIQALAALLPLLGLLGTVFGMLQTFEVIKVEGTGDPRLMADGIRQALITTQAGILAALPVLLGSRYLESRATRIGGRLELAVHRAAGSGNGPSDQRSQGGEG